MLPLFGDKKVVPVVMFHSVGAENMDWVFNYISEPVINFESKIKHLADSGFHFVTWAELYAYMQGDLQLKLPSILLTFDDGYLDNWVYAYPILKKYGAKGTIFVSSDFVDPSAECRFNIDDVHSGKCTSDQLDISGFLNWSEMRAMEASGVIDIQSHAASHTWYFKNNIVRDFWGPDARQYPWMAWNEAISRKPFYMKEDQYSLVRPGTPIYEHDKSLVVRRYLPAPAISDEMAAYVAKNGGDEFFINQDWKRVLLDKYNEVSRRYSSGSRFETDTERRDRTLTELLNSKKSIEKKLNKNVDFLCWPGGGYDDLTLQIAREAGFKSWTLGSADNSNFRNIPGADPENIKRIGSAIRQYWNGQDIGFSGGRDFYYGVRRHQGSIFHKWAGRVFKAGRLLGTGRT